MGWRDLLPWNRNVSTQPQPVTATASPSPASVEVVKVDRSQVRRTSRAQQFSIVAAQNSGGASVWSSASSDYNREYVEALRVVQQRAMDLDVNNPDAHGYHRQRTAQVIGRGVRWSAAIRGEDIGIATVEARKLCLRINRKKHLHSRSGGFDASGRKRTEGKLQEVAFLTHLVLGSVLIHRVALRLSTRICDLAIELIPTTRLSTPYDKASDPCISYGIRYSDEYRTKVAGYYIKRVSRSRGNAMLDEQIWDFIPVEDAVLLDLTEIAGLDRSLPALTSLVRMLRNKGDFIESAVNSARVQSRRAIVIEVAPGASPHDIAADDQEQPGTATDAEPIPVGFVTVGDAEIMYTANGEKAVNVSASLPGPDFKGFMDVADSRCARGLVTSKSRFTREVQSSYSGGRQEEQQDEPVVDQLREAFESAWQRVHEWFVDSLFLVEDFPNYSEETQIYYHEAEITQLSGKLAINPVDSANARRVGYALRTTTPQQGCAEEGRDFAQNIQEWARAIKLIREVESENDLPEGSLDIFLDMPAVKAVAARDEAQVQEDSGNKKPADEGQSFAERNLPRNRIAGISRKEAASV